ncbi:MAG: glycosyltransferase family 4 protein, partial [Desulfobacteraceae bacterium]
LGHDVTVADAKNTNRKTNLNYLEVDSIPRSKDKSEENEKQFVEKLVKEGLSKYDVIHTHSWQTSYFLSEHNISTIYTSHTPIWCSLKGMQGIRWKLNSFRKKHERKVIRDSLLTIALGNYLHVEGAKIKVIPSGFDQHDWERVPTNEKKEFTILFVGRISQIKGVHTLIEAVKRLSFPVKVIILGPLSGKHGNGKTISKYAQKMMKKAEGLPIEFPGMINNNSQQFKEILSSADVMVVPSLFEAQGTVVLEGLSMGLPVIGSNVGGIPMMINDSVGLLFPAGSSKVLSEKIEFLYKNSDIRAKMAENAREHVKNNFSWEKCANKYIKAMKSVIL